MNPTISTSKEDAVQETIECLRARIAKHGAHIDGHETRGRVMLIDPLLSVLGWDPLDPGQVVHEYPVGKKKLDYVLLDGLSRVCVIEAKSLESKLDRLEPGQLAFFLDHPEFNALSAVAYTNGDVWHVYRRANGWDAERLSVSSGQSYKTATEFCRSIGDLRGHAPVLDLIGTSTGDWFAIDDEANFPAGMLPTAIRIDGGAPISAKGWSGMCAEVAKYVVQAGHLSADEIPLKHPRGTRFLINSTPVNSNGTEFSNKTQFMDGLWIDTWGGRQVLPAKASQILKSAGLVPSNVQVRFG